MMKPARKIIYNPHQQTKEQLIGHFIVHQEVFNRIWNDIRVSSMVYPEQHYIIEGQRGMGKTTLLLRIGYEIENDAVLSSWLIPVVLGEESYFGITKLYKLWEEVARSLGAGGQFPGLFEAMEKSYGQNNDHEAFCFNLLMQRLQNKKLLLLVDNINEIFNNFSEKENQRFREVLLTCSQIRLIGAASISLEAFINYKQPFYDFFKKVSLTGLSYDATKLLLLDLGKLFGQEEKIVSILELQPGRIESLRIMAGGVIRTIVILFDIFSNENTTAAFEDLEKILEQVTPLYKSRIDALKPLEREIVQVLSFNWDAMRPLEIAQKVKLAEKEVFEILDQLEKRYFVQWKWVNESKDFYQIYERFFNIWFLMRYAPKAYKNKVIWLVRFFTSWYSRDEIKLWARKHMESMQNESSRPVIASMLTNALVLTGKFDLRTEHLLIAQTRDFLNKENMSFTELLPSEEEILEQAAKLYHAGEESQALMLVSKEDYRSHCLLGNFHMETKNYSKAKECFETALKDDPENINAYHGIAKAFYYLGDRLQSRIWNEKALAIDDQLVKTRSNLGIIYNDEENYTKAAEQFQLAISIDPGFLDAWWGLGNAQFEQKEYQKAETSYLQALSINPKHESILGRLGLTYIQLQEYEKGMGTIEKANTINPLGTGVWLTLGNIYLANKAYRFATDCFKKILEINTGDAAGRIKGLVGLAKVYAAKYEIDQSISYLEEAYKLDPQKGYQIKKNIFTNYWKHPSTHLSPDSLQNLLRKYAFPLTIRLDYAVEQPVEMTPAFSWLSGNAKLFKMPFYDRYQILTIPQGEDPEPFYSLLTDGEEFWPFDGKNLLIYSVNQTDFQVKSENLIAYCLFYFDSVVGKSGKFHLARDAEDLPWWPTLIPNDNLLNKVRLNIHPPLYAGLSDGEHKMEWYMTFKDSIFKANVNVESATGQLSLSDEVLILENLPFQEVDKGDFIDPITVLKKTIKLNPKNSKACLEISRLYADVVMDYHESLVYAKMALDLKPDQVNIVKMVGQLYHLTGQIELAISTYQKGLVLGDSTLATLLASLCFEANKNKELSLDYALLGNKQSPDFESAHILASVYLWHHRVSESLNVADRFLNDPGCINNNEKEIVQYLLFLCAEKQENYVKGYIERQPQGVADFFKPVYYTVLKRLAHIDFKRMPSELKKTVDDLEDEIEKLSDTYK